MQLEIAVNQIEAVFSEWKDLRVANHTAVLGCRAIRSGLARNDVLNTAGTARDGSISAGPGAKVEC